MKPNLFRQYLVDQLKVMRETGEAKVDFHHLELTIRPVLDDDTFDGGQVVILKVRSRLHVVIMAHKDGYWVYEDGGCQPTRHINPKNILAVVTSPSLDVIYPILANQRRWRKEHGPKGLPEL